MSLATLMSGIAQALLVVSIAGTLAGAALMAVDFVRRPRVTDGSRFA